MLDIELVEDSNSFTLIYYLDFANHDVDILLDKKEIINLKPVLTIAWKDTIDIVSVMVSALSLHGNNANYYRKKDLIGSYKLAPHHMKESLGNSILSHFEEFTDGHFIIDKSTFERKFPNHSWDNCKEMFGKQYISRCLPAKINDERSLRKIDYKSKWIILREYYLMESQIPQSDVKPNVKKF